MIEPNTPPKGQSCNTCRFAGTHTSAADPADRTLVRCQRYPPTRVTYPLPHDAPSSRLQRARDATRWPVLTVDGWCGEWAARPPKRARPKRLSVPTGHRNGQEGAR